MFRSVLIANRGEIACRIARTARALGMRTIAVYSEADAGAMHVRMCDEAHPIGPAAAAQSYLAIDRIVAAARSANAECIHPGYGFLSERAEFAEACAAAGIVFVGPPAAAIRAMGMKDRAKLLMERAGVSVVPGYHGEAQDAATLRAEAERIGFPVLIKAVAGGGGKGMRRVEAAREFDAALASARREAAAAFGDERVLVEKYVTAPRHIEIQIFADSHGNVIHLGERDCSLQRRHQKVIEESPAPGISPALRAEIGAAAVAAARACNYVGAGTIEFIADGSVGLKSGGFWFLEMNTRLQVEHPVSEAVTGLDLVAWQFRVAAGERLPIGQADVRLEGHAVEARLYAEDPGNGFLPSTGRLEAFYIPDSDGIRVDAGYAEGDTVTPHYDPMLAKIIAYAATREEALERLAATLENTVVAGPRTNAGFLSALCKLPEFRNGTFDTGTIEKDLPGLTPPRGAVDSAAIAYAAEQMLRVSAQERQQDREDAGALSPWDATDGFQLSSKRSVQMPLTANGQDVLADIAFGQGGAVATVEGVAAADDAVAVATPDALYVLRGGWQTKVAPRDFSRASATSGGDGAIRAPMHGRVIAIFVEKGGAVVRGQPVAVVEAMKMEHTLVAPVDGRVGDILVNSNDQVAEGALLASVEPTKNNEQK